MMRKIGIVGRHPDLEKGFNGVMSLLWARGLSDAGEKVTLYLPVSEAHDPSKLLSDKKVTSLDNLSRFGSNFNIEILDSVDLLHNNTDAVIWQSYRAQEDSILKCLKSKGHFMVKNPPRIFSGDSSKDKKKAAGLASQFDLVAASLNSDLDEGIEFDSINDKLAFVPRGFDTKHLIPDKSIRPTIGFDKAVKAHEYGAKPIEHILASGSKLLSQYPELEYLSLRDNVKELKSTRVPALGYPDFYNHFINRLWLYMPIDFDYSVHVKGKVSDSENGHRYVGLYENQVIETQLAGGLVLSRKGDIPDELMMDKDLFFIEDYKNVNAIVQRVSYMLENFQSISTRIRKKALTKHDFRATTKLLMQEIEKRL